MSTLQRSIRVAVCCSAAILAGCAKKDEAPVDTSSAMTPSTTSTVATAPAAINLADVAGKWDMTSVPTTGTDTSATHYVLTATSNDSGWTIMFPHGKPIADRVRTDADSIIGEAGPFSSVRRKAVQVTTNSVLRLSGGKLVGTTVAHYKVKSADSVLTLTTTGTRAK